MQTFAGPAFANLRRSVNISEEEYETSLASPEPYLQFISNSKSKADFFITCVLQIDLSSSQTSHIENW